MYTFEALQILIFLIPGFISSTILNALVVRKKKGTLAKIVESLIFSLFIYTFYSLVVNKSPIALLDVGGLTTFSYDGKAFLLLFGFSFIIPLILGFLTVKDYHMKFARFLKLSKRTSRGSVWFDVFYEQETHIIINFSNGRRIFGWPMYYSDDPDYQYIYLDKPSWVVQDEQTKESKYIELDIEGILITPEQKIESIEFLQQ